MFWAQMVVLLARETLRMRFDFANGAWKANSILPKTNQILGNAWESLEKLPAITLRKRINSQKDLGDSSEQTAPKLISISEALSKLGVTTDDQNQGY